MDNGTSQIKDTDSRNIQAVHSSGQNPCEIPQDACGKVVELGKAFVKTIRHFWPEFNSELSSLPDTRYAPFVEYDQKFLAWWGLLLFCFKLGSRRQLDFDLRDLEMHVLDNANRLANTNQQTLPVHKTLDHYLGHVGSEAFAELRTECVRRLIRMKALDACRLLGHFVIAIDGSGYLVFNNQHCPNCIRHNYGSTTLYLHPILEAKIVAPEGLALSVGTEFIENPIAPVCSTEPSSQPDIQLTDYEKHKQDCELKAFARLAPALKKDFPQTRFCIGGDSLLACGFVFQTCKDSGWAFVLTFKPGRMPSVWEDFQGLLKLCPENSLRVNLPNGIAQHFRWVNDISYVDSEGRHHTFDAIICLETQPGKETQTFAWVTSFHVTTDNVLAIAEKGGRVRWKIENQGFNIQKNSGLNLEHAYSFDKDNLKSYYYLLQIAHIFLQMVELGSLLKHLARQYEVTPLQLFGSLKNMAKRLLDSFRYFRLPDDAFDPLLAKRCQIRLNTS